MNNPESLTEGVVLGYGDLVQIAYDFDGAGSPVWRTQELDPTAAWLRATSGEDSADPLPYLTTFVVEGETTGGGIAMGEVLLRKLQDGYWEPYLHFLDMGSTRTAVAVRVLGTLGAEVVRQLIFRGSAPLRESIADADVIPGGAEFEALLNDPTLAPDRPREPLWYPRIRADLSQVGDATPYTQI